MNHIPYKGTGPALTDTIGGQIDLFFSSTAKRLAAEPGVPTIAESGVPGYDVPLWHGLIGPKGLPRAIVERINAEQFGERIQREISLWRKVVADTGVKVE